MLSRLPDSKPEVRTIAAATLAGMIKGLPQQQAEQLRKQVLADARRLLAQHPKAASRAAAGGPAAGEEAVPRGGGAPGDLLQRHAAVLVSGVCARSWGSGRARKAVCGGGWAAVVCGRLAGRVEHTVAGRWTVGWETRGAELGTWR